MFTDDIKVVHIELTDRCQASCPMCARNWNGGQERSSIQNVDISFEEFKSWFPETFIKNLKHFYACGNLGDPVIAKDCFEIFDYVRKLNPSCELTVYTNGSLRTPEWWAKFAKVIYPCGNVVFGIDGFAKDHEYHRRGTSWQKIIDNATAFINAGGSAIADTIIFKHNEDQVLELKDYLLGLGFKYVNLKTTQRFHGNDSFPVHDKEGKTEYYLEQPTQAQFQERVIKIDVENIIRPSVYKDLHDNANIVPECITHKSIYINAMGEVYPCCQVSAPITNKEIDGSGAQYEIRSRIAQSAHTIAQDIGVINLHGTDIVSAFKNSKWEERLTHFTTVDKQIVCIKSCARNIRNLVEGTDNDQEYVKFV